LNRLRAAGVDISPVLSCPFLRLSHVRIDVLHVCDLGIT
jgi:hypothetical protein